MLIQQMGLAKYSALANDSYTPSIVITNPGDTLTLFLGLSSSWGIEWVCSMHNAWELDP